MTSETKPRQESVPCWKFLEDLKNKMPQKDVELHLAATSYGMFHAAVDFLAAIMHIVGPESFDVLIKTAKEAAKRQQQETKHESSGPPEDSVDDAAGTP